MLFKRAKPVLNDNAPQPALTAADIPSVIGREAEITGNFVTSADVHVEGIVHGMVKARRCVIEPDGLVEGQVLAEEVVVRGQVQGPIKAYHVHLEAGASVAGDIVNDGIVIDNGAELTGSVWRSENPLAEDVPGRERRGPAAADHARFLETSQWPPQEGEGYRPLAASRLR